LNESKSQNLLILKNRESKIKFFLGFIKTDKLVIYFLTKVFKLYPPFTTLHISKATQSNQNQAHQMKLVKRR